ncbi:zinc finger protein 624-like [Cylas formicarius]|uniref:zinc finger protein 624-like n=1 Tax=Cylas formicarius TaxID=197179 RepID=UPI0029587C74|nr:zinc finger protein 624-like [Cylas formicarius]
MECMFCKRTGERTFNLYSQYGNAPNSIRDDMVELFGLEIESYLDEMEDYVCNVCMNMLDNITKMRRYMMNIIRSPREYKYAMKFGRFWDAFASYKFNECDFDAELITPSRTPTPLLKSRTPKSSSLVTHRVSREYDDPLDEAVGKSEQHRSESRSSSRSCERSDDEVKKYFVNTKKKKLRGHNWSRRSRRRDGLSSSGSTHRTPSHTPKSRQIRSAQSAGKDWTPKPIILEYDINGELLRKRTRSVNHLEKLQEERKYRESSKVYQCEDDSDCSVYMEDLKLFTDHRISEHGKLALYPCLECSATYTTPSHLRIHEKCHDLTPRLCLMCGSLIDNFVDLQKHLDEHLEYSTPCAYCDFSFTSKLILEKHVQTSHLGKKHRIYRRPKPCILEKIDSGIAINDEGLSDNEEKNYEGRIYILALKKQHSVSMKKVARNSEMEIVGDVSERLSDVLDLVEKNSAEDLNKCNNPMLNDYCPESDGNDVDQNFENNMQPEVISDDSTSEIS